MAKKLIKKYLPHPERITENRWIKMLGPRLQEPDLWHINRKSCSGAVAVGMFCAFMPVPIQMLLAAIGAIWFRYNILVAVPTVWVSNPVTMPPMFYFCYWIGTLLLGVETGELHFELTFRLATIRDCSKSGSHFCLAVSLSVYFPQYYPTLWYAWSGVIIF